MLKTTLDKMPAQYLKGVGPEIGKLLEKCHLNTVQDILFHLPFRYQDRTKITPISQLRIGEWAVIEGIITAIDYPKRRMLCEISDNTGKLFLLFFHISYAQKSGLETGVTLRCFGEIKYSSFGITLIHPEYDILSTGYSSYSSIIPETLTPIYPSTEGLTQKRWRKITDEALLLLNKENLPDYLESYLNHHPDNSNFTFSLHNALRLIHRPPPDININLLLNKKHPAQLRLAFEELLAHYLSLKMRRKKIKQQSAPILETNTDTTKQAVSLFLNQFSFDLTEAQKKVIQEIRQDISQPHPMLRLVQGDVGCGKTIVAAVTALYASYNNVQTAFMVPTELLSEQHYENFKKWFDAKHGYATSIPVYWLTSKLKLSEKKIILEKIKSEDNMIIIGTHALFQEKAVFKNLGLVIIDEQHRFGVEQRLALKQKGVSPHQLMMTATPIPRTLAMTCYADLNISVIDRLPPNRIPIKTAAIPQSRRAEIITRIMHAHKEKRQIYWVCTLIEDSEKLQSQAAETTARDLKKYLPDLNIQLIHGKLNPSEKEKIMRAFKQGKIDLLVATTVIEVGVDVPNASVMIIENAERLGLAQLHQLRGRVGRSNQQSYCILLYQTPLSFQASERLRVMREYHDGFKIAEKDLALRGPGEFLGTRQTGVFELRIADLARDRDLFEQVQQTGEILSEKSPAIITSIVTRWIGGIEKFQEV